MNRTVWLGLAFLAAVIGVIVWSTMGIAKYRVEVCIDYNGQSNCRTASADSEEHALRTATSNACATIASGVTEVMQCERVTPKSVKWLKTR